MGFEANFRESSGLKMSRLFVNTWNEKQTVNASESRRLRRRSEAMGEKECRPIRHAKWALFVAAN
jgi:hypothetical protein